ncbi:unnamed protein product [Cylindrotheca closterium]|uniref:Sulfotransferase domain-containing protein n=1 Tax=Cylindrotheca closterium TaxID=2856 RepID=A0AAD2G3B1_9STRA|nr:unnamed protein product [Cylindrotheca closterium]
MQIRGGRKRKLSQSSNSRSSSSINIVQTNVIRGGKVLLGFGVCLLIWSSFMDDEQNNYYAIDYHYPSLSSTTTFSHSPPEPPNNTPRKEWRTKLIFDFALGPAVEKAKYFGFANRESHQGHNRSDWDLLAVPTCDANGEDAVLSELEIYQRKLPTAILLGVQKGGTTALSKYLFQHDDIERSEKELYVLDEAMDYHLFQEARAGNVAAIKLPRKRGRDLYSQMTMGITQKIKRRSTREQQLGLVRGDSEKRAVDVIPTEEETRKRRLEMRKRFVSKHGRVNKGQRHIQRNPGGPPRRQLLEEGGEEEEENTDRPERSPRGVDDDGSENNAGSRKEAQQQQQQQSNTPPRKASIEAVIPSWDPDEKMKRYFARRKMAYQQNPHKKMVLDMTPNYMMHSDRVPARIECLVPWVKLFCILRDPIDRAISQYDMKMRVVKNAKHNKQDGTSTVLLNGWGNPVPSLDQFVLNDLEALYEVGVLQDWNKVDFESFWDSEECQQAWLKYIHLGLNAPIGMGLYAIQLKPFLDVLEKIHQSPEIAKDHFLALDNQDLRKDPDGTYNRVLKFMNLQPKTLEQYKTTINQATGPDGKRDDMYRLSKATEDRIRIAIKPYNQKLGELLGEEWATKWQSNSASP